MKNYLKRLGLGRRSSAIELEHAITRALNETGDIRSLSDAETVLTDNITRAYYERTHLQYEAIKAALACLDHDVAVDTHRWPDRLIEFDVETASQLDR